MENTMPVSDLRFYNQTLSSVEMGNQVILTKNGRSKYVVADIDEWNKMKATIQLFGEIQKGVLSMQNEEPMTIDELDAEFEA
jgi:uncharacterized membrane protein